MKKLLRNIPNKLLLFFAVTAIVGLALGLSDMVFSNYFKDAYNVSAVQRGLIEFPRELPGLLCIILISILSFLGDIRIAIITQALSFIGVLALGLLTPTFAVMLIFLFINSLGMHLYMPVVDSIGMNLVEDKRKLGKRMGQYKSVNTAFQMIAGLFVFIGFRYDIFRFDTQIKWIFILSAALFLVALLLYIQMSRKQKVNRLRKNLLR
ncbi:MAG: hypothetical protein KAQ68_09175 [Clostridiales bacterium]|nr:hypothetical protein [Clostridiales bacterium]